MSALTLLKNEVAVVVALFIPVFGLLRGRCARNRVTEKKWRTRFVYSLCAQLSGSRFSQLGKNQVAFYTYMSGSVQISSLRVKKTLVYDRVETNVGNGYDVTSGNFIVPENGVYAFYVTIVAEDKSHCSVQLVKNDIVKDIG
ncbi:uncharacterized protein LOC134269643 [Saccostrea cucullata]|uniref:uncharacterized protein LOC134269643 n=1 Tax=Saccostrea cuccullata TaxID=36930 RepID=UPI002ED40380